MNKSLEKTENVLLSEPKNFVALAHLAAAFSQCKDGFKVEVVLEQMNIILSTATAI